MASTVFRSLLLEEFDAAHGILVSAAEWLMVKGIRQWTTAYPKDLYRAQQARGLNYGLFVDGQLAVIATLTREPTTTWTRALGTEHVWWLSKLAAAPAHRGRGLGAEVVREACRLVARKGAHRVHLDCAHGSGRLVRFYEQLGFTVLDRQVVRFSTGEFDMVLMSAASGPCAGRPSHEAPVEAAAAVDAQNAPTAAWKTTERFSTSSHRQSRAFDRKGTFLFRVDSPTILLLTTGHSISRLATVAAAWFVQFATLRSLYNQPLMALDSFALVAPNPLLAEPGEGGKGATGS